MASCTYCAAALPRRSSFCNACGRPTGATVPLYAPAPVGEAIARRSRLTAGLLGIAFPGLGVHRFYLGFVLLGVLQIVFSIVTLGVGILWGFVEGIFILTGRAITKDADGEALRD